MVVLEVSELIRNPIRTGIQRVVRELIRRWPQDIPMRLARFEEGQGLVPVPEAVKAILIGNTPHTEDSCVAKVCAQIGQACAQDVDPLPPEPNLLVPELFYDHARSRFYHQLLTQNRGAAAFIVYDFIPWLYPDAIHVKQSAHMMPYLRLLRLASKLAFISARTRSDYQTRIMRGAGVEGPVLRLGADGIALEKQSFEPTRRDFVYVGSLDGRKNQHLVLQAFQQLWEQGIQAPLVLVGRAFEATDVSAFELLDGHPLFEWRRHATDDALRDILRRARSTIFASTLEGYGLPPVESLYAGIPVICSEQVPSISDFPGGEVIRLSETTPDRIREAVLQLMNDDFAQHAWAAAAGLRLGTWADFARQTAQWISSD